MAFEVGQSIPAAFAAAEVIDSSGHPHTLASRWQSADALLVFVRHFACAGCAQHLAALRPRIDEITRLGVTATIVGSGSAEQLAVFVEREELADHDVACFTDPTRAAYRAAGFERSVWGTFGPIAIGQLVRAYSHGFRNGRAQGDLHQQGGTLYVRRGGTLAFYHRAHHLGDHAKLVDIVDIALAERAAAL